MAQVGGNWKLRFYSEIYKNADVILELGQANKDPSKGKSSEILIEVDPNFALGMLKSKIRRPPKRRLRDLFQACAHAGFPDFLNFRQPNFYQKLPIVVV